MRVSKCGEGGARVIMLGGTGLYGHDVARMLMTSPLVGELVIAGRDVEAGRRTAAGLGDRAVAASVDILAEGELTRLASDADLVVNAAGPTHRVTVPALRETIAAGTDYCDLCAELDTAEEALSLDAAARNAGVTALLGVGVFPGASNLTVIHAARQLDTVEEVRSCIFMAVGLEGGGPEHMLSKWRTSGRVDAGWLTHMHAVTRPVREYRDGCIVAVDPLEAATSITLPQGHVMTGYPVNISETLTLSRVVQGLKRATTLWSFYPPRTSRLAFALGERIARGELDESTAAAEVFEDLAGQPPAALAAPAGCEKGWAQWAEAIGTKNGRRTSYRCWPRGDWNTSQTLQCAAAFKLLRNDVGVTGVLPPEACLDPLPFLAEAACLAGWDGRDEELLSGAFADLR